MEIGAEIVRHRFARGVFVRGLHPCVSIVDAPQIERQSLAEMTEDDLQAWQLVEQAAADQPQRMHRGLGRKRPVGPEQPVMARVVGYASRQWVTRMQIEGDVQAVDQTPE